MIIKGAVAFDEVATKKISQLPEDERNDWLWDLRFELLRADLEFRSIEIPLKRVEVVGRICFDALAKDAFINKVSQARKGVLIIVWVLARKVAERPPRKELGFHI